MGYQKSEDRVVPVSWFSGVYVESHVDGASIVASADHKPLSALPGEALAEAAATVSWTDLLAEVQAAVGTSARAGAVMVGYVVVTP